MTMDASSVASEFEHHRPRLLAIARRMLGSTVDAEDAVQEAWLRLTRAGDSTITNPAGWLTTVVGRVCIDMLRERKSRPESPYVEGVTAWVVADDVTPEDEAVLADSVGLALLVVLDTLSPDERLAFILHDVFAVPFDEIAPILGRSTGAAKMLASRARGKVRGERSSPDRQRHRDVVDAFLRAARGGDFAALLQVLAPDVVWRGHTSRGVVAHLGATEVANRLQNAGRATATVRRVSINGKPGVMAWSATGAPLAVMACTVVDDRIVEIESVIDPELLAAMTLPDVHPAE